MNNNLEAHGGKLINLMVDGERAEALKTESKDFPSHSLSKRQLCDLELLLTGGFSPLSGFLGRDAYDSVVEKMRLPDGTLWPIPIVLDVPSSFAERLEPGQKIALRDPEGFMPAVLTVEESWQPDKNREAQAVYGMDSASHPGVRYLYDEVKETYIS
ncbi:MAG: adenylyltransferase, partial [Deltaproteobacteria bacterium]|nr:adenylyltransferase [Deltaproteobacteria bacterium]